VIKAKEVKFWLKTLGYPLKERAPRRSPTGLTVLCGPASSRKQFHIAVISTSGLYINTSERWPVGEILSLTLQKEAVAAQDSEFQVEVQARVASHGEDGVGLGFILPSGLNAELWDHLIEISDTPTEAEDTQFIFRMVRAILFLYRLCPSNETEPLHSWTGDMDESRSRNMLRIALMAEKMLAVQPNADKMRAHPQVVTAILREASWHADDVLQRLWAGLLVSSCNEHGTDTSNMELVELLVQVTKNQGHILIAAYKGYLEKVAEQGGQGIPRVFITQEEMIGITEMYDLYRNATDVAYLHGYGLLEKNFDFSTHSSQTTFDVTPTALGVRLLKACRADQLDQVANLT
jgi:hypothetical protein